MEQPAALNADWRKSSHSGQSGGSSCIEVGETSRAVLIRDTTQHGTGPILRVSAETWKRFTTGIQR
jgi:hypothetical protein